MFKEMNTEHRLQFLEDLNEWRETENTPEEVLLTNVSLDLQC